MEQSLKIKSKSKEEAIAQALAKLNVGRDEIEVEVIENPSKGFLGIIGAKDGLYEITVIEKKDSKNDLVDKGFVRDKKVENATETKVENSADREAEVEVSKKFIEGIIKNANIEAEVKAVQEGNLIKIDISGKDASTLIGRRGETLDSLQLLTGLALNKINKDSKMRVFIDIGNYRKKRKESLIRYANKTAREVAKTKKTKKLDYMNPYERRIIHSALQNDKYVITYSEGTDPYRRLVIECKG